MFVSSTGIKNEGKTSVKVAAGTFNCYKLFATANVKIKGAGLMGSAVSRETASMVYFDPEIGILKTEDLEGKNQTGYVELFRVKR